MKKAMGKIKGIVFAAIMALSIAAVTKMDAKAATEINVNQEYQVTISGKNPEFTFTTPESGITSVEAVFIDTSDYVKFCNIKLIVDYRQYWYDLLMDSSGKQYSNPYVFQGGQKATLQFDLPSENEKYTVAFKVTCTNPGNLEKEPNNSASAANVIKQKVTYNGILNKEDEDSDWFVFKAPKTGNYRFEVVNTDTTNDGIFDAVGYKSKNKVDTNNQHAFITGGKGWYKSKKFKLKKGKKYYIKLSTSGLYHCPYQIRVKKVK